MVNPEPKIHCKRLLVMHVNDILLILRPSVLREHASEILEVVNENLTGDLDSRSNLSRD